MRGATGRRPRRERPTGPRTEPTRHPLRSAYRRSRSPEVVDPLDTLEAIGWLAARDEQGSFSAEALARDEEWAAIVPLIEACGATPGTELPRLATFAAEILKWNRSVSNLVSLADEQRLVSRHIRESLEPAAWLREAHLERWIDFGSGAGFPALPLAICGVGAEWTLVESRRPKALFLRRITEILGLRQVQIAHARLEELIQQLEEEAPDLEGPLLFDGFTSRATMLMAPTLDLAARVVRPGGSAFLWKGSRGIEELAETTNPDWSIDSEKRLESGEVEVFKLLRKN